MRLTTRLTVVFGVLGLLTIPTVATLSWVLADDEIRSAIDDQLLQQVERIEALGSADLGVAVRNELPTTARPFPLPDELGDGLAPFASDGSGIAFYDVDDRRLGDGENYLDESTLERLESGESGFLSSVETNGRTVRTVTVRLDDLASVPADVRVVETMQLFNDITNDESALSRLAVGLFGASVAGVLIVVGGGFVVGRWLAQPVLRVTDAAEQLAELEDLPGRIVVDRTDELGRLAASFNRMLAALEIGREQQQRLVADASHELRTPLTSLRLRAEFLVQHTDMEPDERERHLRAAVADVEQLSALVADLVDLAADVHVDDEEPEVIRLADVVDTVVSRTSVASGRRLVTDVDDTEVTARTGMVRRAIQNLVDNAIKYSPSGEPIIVRSHRGSIEVDDRGPGIAADESPHVFDRFYRSPKARNRPGHGIGLAIVKQVADAHGGTVWATTNPDGGARVGFSVGRSNEDLDPTARGNVPARRQRVIRDGSGGPVDTSGDRPVVASRPPSGLG